MLPLKIIWCRRFVRTISDRLPRYHVSLEPSSEIITKPARLFTSITVSLSKMETNNSDLELGNLFNVKNKVALVTGGGATDFLQICFSTRSCVY